MKTARHLLDQHSTAHLAHLTQSIELLLALYRRPWYRERAQVINVAQECIPTYTQQGRYTSGHQPRRSCKRCVSYRCLKIVLRGTFIQSHAINQLRPNFRSNCANCHIGTITSILVRLTTDTTYLVVNGNTRNGDTAMYSTADTREQLSNRQVLLSLRMTPYKVKLHGMNELLCTTSYNIDCWNALHQNSNSGVEQLF